MTRKAMLVLVAAGILAVQVAAASATAPSHAASASCKAQLAASGKANFDALYTSMGGCVSKMSKLSAPQRQDVVSAEKTCRAAQVANASAFEAKYGTNTKTTKKGARENAFGKCVSVTASAKASK